jgi:hypothetical protein
MKRWHKTVLLGTLAAGAAYGGDALISRDPDPRRRFGLAAVPGAIAGLAVATVTWLVSQPDPPEFPEQLAGLGYYTWPPSCLPEWPYVAGWNAYVTDLPPGTAGKTQSR